MASDILYAARTYSGNIYALPDTLTSAEQTELVRKLSEEDLICPVIVCDSPQLMFNEGTHGNRMHLSHLIQPSPPHTPEEIENSVWRFQAKNTLAGWLTGSQNVRVSKERFHHGGERKPVLTVMMTGGEKIAVEFTADSGEKENTVEGWRQVDKQYSDKGEPVVWFLPTYGEDGIENYEEGASVTLTRFHRLLLENDIPLLWFNPSDRSVSTVVVKRRKEGVEYSIPPTRATLTAILHTCKLEECFLASTGLQHPALLEAKENLQPDAVRSTDMNRLRNQIRAKATAAGEMNLPDCYPNLGFTINPSLATSWTELQEKIEENGYGDPSEILYVRNLYEDDVDERMARALKRKDTL